MITRVVIMNFERENLPEFYELFSRVKDRISGLPGCKTLTLKQNTSQPEQLVTISQWDSEDHLNAYRDSELFKETWAKTKKLFSSKAVAFSLEDTLKT